MGKSTEDKKGNAVPFLQGGLAYDLFSWALNIVSALVIIFVNKHLMGGSLGFRFATTLAALHYLVSALYISLSNAATVKREGSSSSGDKAALVEDGKGVGEEDAQPLPPPPPPPTVSNADLIIFVITANVSIVALNLSLMLNSVGFYQISKLLIAPFVCLVEFLWLGRHFPPRVVASILVVLLGVGVVTVSGTTSMSSTIGLFVAAVSIVGAGMQQILVRHLQHKHGVSSQDLLHQTAKIQGASLLLMGPPLDYYFTGKWVTQYQWSANGLVWLGMSCVAAVAVNLSQFMVLGRFSAGTYSVVGHLKTILVLAGSWLVFGEVLTLRQICGMTAAVGGMCWYGYEVDSQKRQQVQQQAEEARKAGAGGSDEEKVPMLGGTGSSSNGVELPRKGS